MPTITKTHGWQNLLLNSQNKSTNQFNFLAMNWQNLYQEQLNVNQELKKQLEIVESILRNFLPIVENDAEAEKN